MGRPFTFDRVARIVFSVFGLLGALYLLDILKGVLLPFLVACLIAYMLEPVVRLNMRVLHSRRRFLPVILTLVEAIAVCFLFCWFFIPYIVKECTEMGDLLVRYYRTGTSIPYISEQIHTFIRQNVDFEQLSRLLSREQWIELIKKTLTQSWSFLSSGVALIMSVLSWLIVILYVLFIMLDYERLMLSFRQLVPVNQRRRVYRVLADIKNAMNMYFRGQTLIAFIVGVLFSVGFLIVGLPMAVLFGMFIGLLNLVPYLQLISLPIAAVLCMFGSIEGGIPFWTLFWETMAVYVVVQCLQDLVLTPHIMKKAMGLNPAIILLSLSVWGCLLGFTGLIIALPLTTLILSYYDTYVVHDQTLVNDELKDDITDK